MRVRVSSPASAYVPRGRVVVVMPDRLPRVAARHQGRRHPGTACPWMRRGGRPILDGMDRGGAADFLRRRREALQPADLGLAPGARRRAPGLRREEVAALAHMSTDFYARLEQRRGSRPSEQTTAALARALRLTPAERDHLFALAGH